MAAKLITFFPEKPLPSPFRAKTKGDTITRQGARKGGFTLDWVEKNICPDQGFAYTRAWIAASYLSVRGYGVASEPTRVKGRDSLRIWVYTRADYAHVPAHLAAAIAVHYGDTMETDGTPIIAA
jgi:hypothetical protein